MNQPIDPEGQGQHHGEGDCEYAQLVRLRRIVHRIRRECPWDGEQTHRSLTKHLLEEAAEVVDAIESGTGDDDIADDDLLEELGDLLLQVFLQAEIADQQERFNLNDVAEGICNKMIRRHPWVFGDQANPQDMMETWESAKRAEKNRSSALEGIPESLSALARAAKVVSRVQHVHLQVPMTSDPIEANPIEGNPITAEQVGTQILMLVQRAQTQGIDADQATRDALRRFEAAVVQAERVGSGLQPEADQETDLTPELSV